MTKVGFGRAGCTTGFILEPSINISIEDQSIARLHRIGQRNAVTVYRILTKGTIEERILALQAQKRAAAADRAVNTKDSKETLQCKEVYDMFGIPWKG